MADSLQKEILKQIKELFLQAEEEERNYNWDKEVEILKEIEKISLDKKLKGVEGEVYYRLGEMYYVVADSEKTIEKVLKSFQLSISYFQKASDVFKELKNEGRINGALGFSNFLKYISKTETGDEYILLGSAKKYFNAAKQIFIKKDQLIESLKMGIMESRAFGLLIAEKGGHIDETADYLELALEHERLIKDTWEEIKNQRNLPEIYLYHFLLSVFEISGWITVFLSDDDVYITQYMRDNSNRVKEFIDIFENSTMAYTLCIFTAYTFYSWFNLCFAAYMSVSQFEQKVFLKKAQKWLKSADALLPQINSNPVLTCYYYTRFSDSIFLIALGYFAKGFKHVLEDLNRCIDSGYLYFPKMMVTNTLFFTAGSFLVGSLNSSVPENQRISFANKSLELVNLAIKEVGLVRDPSYKIYNMFKNSLLCTANAILGDLNQNKDKKSRHLQRSTKIFNNIWDYKNPKISNVYSYFLFLYLVSRAGIILAINSSSHSERIEYYQKAINLLEKARRLEFPFFKIENLFLIGDTYYDYGKLTNDDEIFKKSYSSYMDAIEYCKNKGYFNLVGSAYINLAQIDDRLGNFPSAAENYKNAIDSFDQAILTLTYTRLSKKIEKLKNYMIAWNLIEVAKTHRMNEDHYNSQFKYKQASQILNNIREYSFESPFYSSWSILEKAEYLSKKNQHQEAAATYLVSKGNFKDAIEVLNSYLGKRKTEEKDRISKLIQVAEIRAAYCNARYQIETARLESKKGNHLLAAEFYDKASILFENICQAFRIKRERDELTAIFYLCKAWESMERADIEQKAQLYAEASKLFEKAGNIFPESRMKKLSVGNSLYCSALEYGSLFDKSIELAEKTNYYKKIKMYLREASKNYQLGGFKQDAQWALATSTSFDGIWHLILSDNEIDFAKKNEYLNVATQYLNKALQIFNKTEYEQKKGDILNYLEMIKNEKEILTSALNIIEKPEISASSIGISAPSCPIEISSSVNIDEMQQTDLKTESEINWRRRIHKIYLFLSTGTCIFTHSFKSKYEISTHLISGGDAEVSSLLQEMTKKKSKIKFVELEEMTILLEYGKYLIAALITEENLVTLQNKLMLLIQDIEDFYQEELESYSENLISFSKVGKFIQKIFER